MRFIVQCIKGNIMETKIIPYLKKYEEYIERLSVEYK